MENVNNEMDNRIDFENLNQEVVEITVILDGNGIPTTTTKFATTALDRARGAEVIYVENLTNRGTFPTTAPFISFEPISTNLYKLNHITGLQSSDKWRILVKLIGN